MNICMIPTLNGSVVHYRMAQFVNQWRKMGHTVGFSYWSPEYTETCTWEKDLKPGDTNEFLEMITDSAKHSDVIIFQSLHYDMGIAVFLALQDMYSKKPFLSEFDDDIYSVHSSSPAFNWTGPGTSVEATGNKQIASSNGLIVSTEYLKGRYSSRNSKVEVIPNAIDFDVWDKLKPSKKDDTIKIGWEGGANHKINLRLIKKVVPVILDKYSNVVFHFKFGGFPIDWLQHNRIIFDDYHKWVPINKHPQALKDANFDIGIAPLRDLDFNRAKSNLRFLEYSALKIPTVASNVEPYKCIIGGETGFIANEEDEWVRCLSELIESKDLRQRIGKNAYELVKSTQDIGSISKRYVESLERFI